MAVFGRTKQKMAEKMNKASGSKYPAEFEASCVLMEGTGAGTRELVERVKKHLESFHSGGMFVVEHLGEAANHLGAGLASDSAYAQSLLALAKMEKAVGGAERAYVKDVQDKVIAVFQDWLSVKFKAFKKERETLERMRLDMDRATTKVREKPEVAELKVAEEARTADHNAQMGTVQRLLELLPGDLDLHKQAVAKLLAIQHSLHTNCLTHIDAFLKEITARL
jgi:hypothetical protein